MATPDTSAYRSFDEITGRLDEIIDTVRDKDTSLERSLDLFDEAIALGSKAVDLVDVTEFTQEEQAKLAANVAAGASDGVEGASEVASTSVDAANTPNEA